MNNSTHINLNEYPSCPYAVSIFFTTTMAVISLAAFIGNFLVIVTVYKTPNLRTSTNYYYVNMAVSDFLASLTTWPLYVTKEVTTSSGSLLQGPLATSDAYNGKSKGSLAVCNLDDTISALHPAFILFQA
ncbi:hypothetical protein ACROYT_G018590 [Oculina patagonica]